jgi:hypothetical protein
VGRAQRIVEGTDALPQIPPLSDFTPTPWGRWISANTTTNATFLVEVGKAFHVTLHSSMRTLLEGHNVTVRLILSQMHIYLGHIEMPCNIGSLAWLSKCRIVLSCLSPT